MRLLFDTHAFIWWDSEPERLSDRALTLCQDQRNDLILSATSLWEIQIKSQLGKITLKTPLSELVREQQESNRLEILSVSARHIYELDALPPLHRDPFDRMLVAQARAEGLHIMSHDTMVKQYPVDVEW